MSKPYYHEGDTAYPDMIEAVIAARRLSNKHQAEYYVLREAGVLRVTDTQGLETFYSDTNDNDILFTTGD